MGCIQSEGEQQLSNLTPVMGFDPSMRNWGVCEGHVDLDTLSVEISQLEVYQAEKQSKEKKKQVRTSSIDFDRSQDIFKSVMKQVRAFKPQCLFVEMPHGSQSASAMKSYGMCIGVLGSIAQASGIPLIQVSESENKKAMELKKGATKQDMIDAVRKLHPGVNWRTRKLKGKLEFVEGWNEHAADAVGAVYAGLESNEFMFIRNQLRLLKGVA